MRVSTEGRMFKSDQYFDFEEETHKDRKIFFVQKGEIQIFI